MNEEQKLQVLEEASGFVSNKDAEFTLKLSLGSDADEQSDAEKSTASSYRLSSPAHSEHEECAASVAPDKRKPTVRRKRTSEHSDGIGYSRASAGAGSSKLQHFPLSERQQLALLMKEGALDSPKSPVQVASTATASAPRSRGKQSRIHRRNERGETLLHVAAKRGDFRQCKALLRQGADVNCVDYAGWTALHEACNHGFYDTAKILLKYGAIVNVAGLGNDTPLHDAVESGQLKLVRLLLKHGADVHKMNSDGQLPIDLSTEASVTDLLRKAQENSSGGSGIGETLMYSDLSASSFEDISDDESSSAMNWAKSLSGIGPSMNSPISSPGSVDAGTTSSRCLSFDSPIALTNEHKLHPLAHADAASFKQQLTASTYSADTEHSSTRQSVSSSQSATVTKELQLDKPHGTAGASEGDTEKASRSRSNSMDTVAKCSKDLFLEKNNNHRSTSSATDHQHHLTLQQQQEKSRKKQQLGSSPTTATLSPTQQSRPAASSSSAVDRTATSTTLKMDSTTPKIQTTTPSSGSAAVKLKRLGQKPDDRLKSTTSNLIDATSDIVHSKPMLQLEAKQRPLSLDLLAASDVPVQKARTESHSGSSSSSLLLLKKASSGLGIISTVSSDSMGVKCGKTTDGKYKTDSGSFHSVRNSPSSLSAASPIASHGQSQHIVETEMVTSFLDRPSLATAAGVQSDVKTLHKQLSPAGSVPKSTTVHHLEKQHDEPPKCESFTERATLISNDPENQDTASGTTSTISPVKCPDFQSTTPLRRRPKVPFQTRLEGTQQSSGGFEARRHGSDNSSSNRQRPIKHAKKRKADDVYEFRSSESEEEPQNIPQRPKFGASTTQQQHAAQVDYHQTTTPCSNVQTPSHFLLKKRQLEATGGSSTTGVTTTARSSLGYKPSGLNELSTTGRDSQEKVVAAAETLSSKSDNEDISVTSSVTRSSSTTLKQPFEVTTAPAPVVLNVEQPNIKNSSASTGGVSSVGISGGKLSLAAAGGVLQSLSKDSAKLRPRAATAGETSRTSPAEQQLETSFSCSAGSISSRSPASTSLATSSTVQHQPPSVKRFKLAAENACNTSNEQTIQRHSQATNKTTVAPIDSAVQEQSLVSLNGEAGNVVDIAPSVDDTLQLLQQDSDSRSSSNTTASSGKSDASLKVPPLRIILPVTSRSSSGESSDNATATVAGPASKPVAKHKSGSFPYIIRAGQQQQGNEGALSSCEDQQQLDSACSSLDVEENAEASEDSCSGIAAGNESAPASVSSAAGNSHNQRVTRSQVRLHGAQLRSDSSSAVATAFAGAVQSSASGANISDKQNVAIHPRKRKTMRAKDDSAVASMSAANVCSLAPIAWMLPTSCAPIGTRPAAAASLKSGSCNIAAKNCLEAFRELRNAIEEKWNVRGAENVHYRKPPNIDKFYVIKKSYLLQKTLDTCHKETSSLDKLPDGLKQLFVVHEENREVLRKQHQVQRERVCLLCEKEVLRVYNRCSRAASNVLETPFNCMRVLHDDEIYNPLELDKQPMLDLVARDRCNAKQMQSWAQEVQERFRKRKLELVQRQKMETDSLFSVQKMEWEAMLKKLKLAGIFNIPDAGHVPRVSVDADFSLLPAA